MNRSLLKKLTPNGSFDGIETEYFPKFLKCEYTKEYLLGMIQYKAELLEPYWICKQIEGR